MLVFSGCSENKFWRVFFFEVQDQNSLLVDESLDFSRIYNKLKNTSYFSGIDTVSRMTEFYQSHFRPFSFEISNIQSR